MSLEILEITQAAAALLRDGCDSQQIDKQVFACNACRLHFCWEDSTESCPRCGSGDLMTNAEHFFDHVEIPSDDEENVQPQVCPICGVEQDLGDTGCWNEENHPYPR